MIEKKLSFEQALAQLEDIVDNMQSGDVPLEELIAHFEKGSQLVTVCRSQLAELEQKIEQLATDTTSTTNSIETISEKEDSPISPRKQPKKIAKKEDNPFLF